MDNIFMRREFCMPVIWVHRHMLTTQRCTALEFPEEQLIKVRASYLLGGPGKALRGSHHMEPLRLGDDGESFAEKQSCFSLTKSSKQTGDSWEASWSCIRNLLLCNK